MNNSHSASYAAAGVNIEAGYEGVRLMKQHVQRTFIPGVVSDIGGFGGLFRPELTGMKDPVLVSGTDGVGTKQRIAQLMGIHNTVGIDCVAMCVNDIICCGAKPLFFLDYIAIGRNEPEKVASLVSGVAEGCVQAGCALIGGETAEHPGTMQPEDYDLAGFSVGIVDQDKILRKASVREGDIILGLPSSGIHSKLGMTLGEALLTPTRIYVKPILAALETGGVHGISHITGGGFYENIPRCLPDGYLAKIEKAAIPVLPIFRLLQERGGIPERDMFNTFNMGIGMSLVVAADQANAVKAVLPDAVVIGEIVRGDNAISIA